VPLLDPDDSFKPLLQIRDNLLHRIDITEYNAAASIFGGKQIGLHLTSHFSLRSTNLSQNAVYQNHPPMHRAGSIFGARLHIATDPRKILMNVSDLLAIVIEPSRMQRKLILAALERQGVVDVEEFDSAEPALQRMQTLTPDLVVSSMHLPDMTGTDLLHRMREDERLQEITFLLVSSETHYRYLEPIRQSGSIAILPKPFKEEDLGKALASTLAYIDAQHSEGDEEFEFLRVLVVDDSRMSRHYVRQILESIGIHSITESSNGAEALAQISQHEFDLVISDYNMPEVDGRELVEHIRTDSSQSSIPVLMITSEQNESNLAAIENAGVSALCNKPLAFEGLRGLIHRLIAEH